MTNFLLVLATQPYPIQNTILCYVNVILSYSLNLNRIEYNRTHNPERRTILFKKHVMSDSIISVKMTTVCNISKLLPVTFCKVKNAKQNTTQLLDLFSHTHKAH